MERIFLKGGVFIVLVSMLLTGLTFSKDKDIVNLQGLVMEVDFKKNMIVVNERTMIWDQETNFYNENGTPVSLHRLKPKTWVYVEGFWVEGRTSKRVYAQKVYFLPKYIDEKEKASYPFIK